MTMSAVVATYLFGLAYLAMTGTYLRLYIDYTSSRTLRTTRPIAAPISAHVRRSTSEQVYLVGCLARLACRRSTTLLRSILNLRPT
jgi:hypothetical protein